MEKSSDPGERHPVALVTYPTTLHAWVLDLPGCIAGALDEAALAATLPITIAEHLAWLSRHGERLESRTGWRVVERLDGRDYERVGGEFCLDADRAALAPDELERLIRRMTFARAGLLAAVDGLPDALLDWQPPLSAMRSVDPWAPEARTIRGVLEHVLQLEAYYRDGLRDGPSSGIFSPVSDPTTERALTLDLLRALDDATRSRVYRPTRPSRDHAEEWTVRKLIRRTISHERAHTAEIQQRRTWPLLGLPTYPSNE